ncbi:MAG TPA: sigma-70 family RNA polymerase sigma factor [Verrucomicrobiae bacterium]|nr:sigma-70 family RNA polymerase sigma factor [Verrucomicrobiae bacterium]
MTPLEAHLNGLQSTAAPEPPDPSWSGLVERIRSFDPSGMEDLYRIFSKGIRFLLYRQFGPQDLDDKVHDAFLVITQSIQRGDLREPERLMGYIRTVVRRQISAYIQAAINRRRNYADLELVAPLRDRLPNPEHRMVEQQKLDLALRLLNSIPKRDREVLIRFYLREQAPDQICDEMGLTTTQFRLIKSRAKARFGELGRRCLSRRSRASA